MTVQTRSTAFVSLAVVATVLVRLLETQRRYTFGHAHQVDIAVVALLYLLAATHGVIAGIMWLQRSRWLPSDAAMFRFIGVKAVFWMALATGFQFLGRGIPLDNLALFILMGISTVDLDVRLIRRYLYGSEDQWLFGADITKGV